MNTQKVKRQKYDCKSITCHCVLARRIQRRGCWGIGCLDLWWSHQPLVCFGCGLKHHHNIEKWFLTAWKRRTQNPAFEMITSVLTDNKLLHLLPLKIVSCFMSNSDGDSPLDALCSTDGNKTGLVKAHALTCACYSFVVRNFTRRHKNKLANLSIQNEG